MNEASCIKCGKTDGLKFYSFLTVNVQTSSSTSGRTTRTTTTESLNGATSCFACGDCIRKRRISGAVGTGLGTWAGVWIATILFGAYFIGKKTYNNNFPTVVLVGLALGAVVGLIVLLSLLRREDPFVAALLKKDADKKADPAAAARVYVPADPALYVNRQTNQPDLSVFTRKTGLKTALAATVFVLVLSAGNGGGAQGPAAGPAPQP